MKKDAFDSIHPIVEFAFFAFAIVLPMLLLHPVLIGISFLAALLWSLMLNGRKILNLLLKFILPVMIAVAILNPLFNHQGTTVLFYLKNNPVTLESVGYGFVSAMMFASVILWFSCFNRIMQSDKIIYLFGTIAPSISLIITMSMRFVPLFGRQIKKITLNEKCMGNLPSKGKTMEKIRSGLNILSAMITWALESAIITSDSMRARGCGLRGRTSFSPYRFDARDIITGIFLALGIAAAGVSAGMKSISIRFFPSFEMNPFNIESAAFYLIYSLTLLIPIILNIREAIIWRSLKSKI